MLPLATRCVVGYNLPMLVTITSSLLAGIGVVADSYLQFHPQKTADKGSLVIAQANGRIIIGVYFPTETDALFYLPGRSIIATQYKIIGRLVPLNQLQ